MHRLCTLLMLVIFQIIISKLSALTTQARNATRCRHAVALDRWPMATWFYLWATWFGILSSQTHFIESWHIPIFTVRNVVAARLCFHRRLWFCSQGGCVADTPLGRPPLQTPPPPLSRWLLQRTVRILLECILVSLPGPSKFDPRLVCHWPGLATFPRRPVIQIMACVWVMTLSFHRVLYVCVLVYDHEQGRSVPDDRRRQRDRRGVAHARPERPVHLPHLW